MQSTIIATAFARRAIKATNASCESFINVSIDKLDEIKIKGIRSNHTQKGGPKAL